MININKLNQKPTAYPKTETMSRMKVQDNVCKIDKCCSYVFSFQCHDKNQKTNKVINLMTGYLKYTSYNITQKREILLYKIP